MITITQKLIQIGSSEGVTLSKKDLARLGAKKGDLLNLQVELAETDPEQQNLMREYRAFQHQYGDTLKRLADK